MLESYLTELQELEFKLKEHVERDNIDQLKAVDIEHNKIWTKLLLYVPENHSECKKLAVFFVDRLLDGLENSPKNEKIRNRIVELFD